MKIAVSGYYGFGNTGDEAILLAIKKGFIGHELLVLDAQNRFNFKFIRDCDVFLSGGGGLLQDKTSSRSFFYYIGLIWLAKLLGKKVYIFAQSIGPIDNPLNILLLKKILIWADLITVRDEISFNFIKSLKLHGLNVIKTADPTFLLEPQRTNYVSKETSGPFIAVCPREFNGMPDAFDATLAKLCDKLIAYQQANVILMPFQPSTDIEICRSIKKKMTGRAQIIEEKDPLKTMGIISQMDFVIGMRLHSLIFAVNMFVPAVGISYDPKVRSFGGEAGLPAVDPSEIKDSEAIYETIKKLLDNSSNVKNNLEICRSTLYARAMKNFELIGGIA